MALYHFHVSQVSRGKGQSCLASDAYITGTQLLDDYYGEIHDYTKKQGVLYTELLLPDYAPERLRNRETLFNEIEVIEKHPKAQLCYTFDFSLQNELTYEENLEIARKYIRDNFVAKGMIVDFAIHDPDKHGGIPNPHVHMLIPIRPLNKDGTWGEKQKREYILDETGERIKKPNGKYDFKSVPTTDWGAPETLDAWRKAYAGIFNKAFEEKGLDCRIDHRSYSAQGLELLPTIHEGPQVRAMEAKGFRTEIGDENRRIKAVNEMLKKLSSNLLNIFEWLSDFIKECHKQKIYVPSLGELVTDYYDKRYSNAWSNKAKVKNVKERASVIFFLTQNNINTFDELKDFVQTSYGKVNELQDDITEIDKEISKIKDAFRYRQMLAETKPIYDKQFSFRLKKNQQKYADEHRAELDKYHLAKRMLDQYWCGSKPDWKALRVTLSNLEDSRDKKHELYKRCKLTASESFRIRKIAEEMIKRDDVTAPSHQATRKRKHDIER